MKKTLGLTVLLLLSCMAWAGVGTWRSHLAYHNATHCVPVNGKVYVVSDGSLFSYSPGDGHVEAYDKVNLLSDQGIRHIAVDELSNTLVVVYENANIDLVRPDGSVLNIIDYANDATMDPVVNSISVVKGKAYMATNLLDSTGCRARRISEYLCTGKDHS